MLQNPSADAGSSGSRLPTLETVAHCWRYPRLLRFHLSGFVVAPIERAELTVTVMFCADDKPVADVLDDFRTLRIRNVRWNFVPLDAPRLCRRAIGRNIAGLASTADHVLFVDVDYVFGWGAVDKVAGDLEDVRRGGPYLAYARHYKSSISHEAGDAEILRADGGIISLYDARYKPDRLTRPIGGSQFVLGDWIREHGYLKNSRRWQRPESRWKRTHEDRVFRDASGLRTVPLDCPEIYRIRHSKRGRFDVGVEL